MKVLFLAAEAEPLVKIGGLGDVAGSLPRALRRLSAGDEPVDVRADVRLVIPFHGVIRREGLDLEPLASFAVPHAGGPLEAEAYSTEVGGLPVILIAGAPIPAEAPVYSLYAGADAFKYTFFSLAALELARSLDWAPDIVHANDWHTALAAYALFTRGDPFFARTACLLGVHNLPYLGEGAGPALQAFGLPPVDEISISKFEIRLPLWAHDRPLPLGLLAAGHIVAPSPTYALEILTPEFGSGLDAFLRARAGSISGILNGMDVERWNPQTDADLYAPFSLAEIEARSANKAALLAELGLDPLPGAPLLVMITRLDPQKGVDLVPDALRQIVDLPWQAAVLGAGQPALEAQVRSLEAEYPGRARAVIAYDPALARRLYAGGDILLMPSRYEPCGLSQMIAMRYGCVPLARSVGGLFDTIRDADQSEEGTGFLFGEATPSALAGALRRALRLYADPGAWCGLQRRGMAQDFSWERSAQQYWMLYQSLIRS